MMTIESALDRACEEAMSNLVLELKPGEMMVINGASIRFRTKSRLELTSRARFLFGKQLMLPGEATTPARRVYFALQTAYIGEDSERPAALAAAGRFIGVFAETTTSPDARQILEQALSAALEDRCYAALKLARRVVRHEDALLRFDDGEASADATDDARIAILEAEVG